MGRAVPLPAGGAPAAADAGAAPAAAHVPGALGDAAVHRGLAARTDRGEKSRSKGNFTLSPPFQHLQKV